MTSGDEVNAYTVLFHIQVLFKRDQGEKSKLNAESKFQFQKPTPLVSDCTWWAHPSSLLPFPLFLPKLFITDSFLYYFTSFSHQRAFISAQGSGAPPRRQQKVETKKLNLWKNLENIQKVLKPWQEGLKEQELPHVIAFQVDSHHFHLRWIVSGVGVEGGGLCFYICHSSASAARPGMAITFILIIILINKDSLN